MALSEESQARQNPSRCLVASGIDRSEKPEKQVPPVPPERSRRRSFDGRSYDWRIVAVYDIPREGKRSSDRSPTLDHQICPDPGSESRGGGGEKKQGRMQDLK